MTRLPLAIALAACGVAAAASAGGFSTAYSGALTRVLAPTTDGGALLGGESGPGGSLVLARVDADGAVRWTTALAPSASTSGGWQWTTAAERPDGTIVLAGGFVSGDIGGSLLELDGDGVLRSWRTYAADVPDSDESWLTSVEAAPDGTWRVTGGACTLAWERPCVAWIWEGSRETVLGDLVGESWSVRRTRSLPGGGFVALGVRRPLGGRGEPWLGRFSEDHAVVWERTYPGGELAALLPLVSGNLAVVGSAGDGWLLVLDPDGQPLLSRSYGLGGATAFTAIVELPDGDLVMAGSTADASGWRHALLVRVSTGGDVRWSRTYEVAASSSLDHVWVAPDGRLRAGGTRVDSGWADPWLLAVELDGTLASGCLVPAPHSPAITARAMATGPTSHRSLVVPVNCGSPSLAPWRPGVEAHDSCECTELPAPVGSVRAVRSGGDVVLSWPATVGACHVWWVEQKERIDDARLAGMPVARGVIGCSPPAPAADPSCLHADASGPGSPPLLFYQVRPVCGAGVELP